MTAILECQGVTQTFGGIVALDDLSVTVPSGEITGLIGPNGAGKTTLFNVVSGILSPDRGMVTLAGTEITGWQSHAIARAGISRTFQTPRPIRSLTVEENLRVANHFGTDEASVDVDRILDLLDLGPRRGTHTDQLQMVQRKYVDLGRALAMDPDIILLDEMMAGLNPTETSELIETIRDIHDTFDVDFLLIEHNLRAIRSLSDTVVVIHEGRHLATGPPADVLEQDAVQEAYIG